MNCRQFGRINCDAALFLLPEQPILIQKPAGAAKIGDPNRYPSNKVAGSE